MQLAGRSIMILVIALMLGLAVTHPMPLAPSTETLLFVKDGSIPTQERYVVRVPEDFPTIQAAIDTVAEGGTVLIGPGVYKENLKITKSLRLVGAGQERVQIQYKDPYRPIILFVSATMVQIHIQDLTIGDPTFPIEQVVIPPTPTSPSLSGIGLNIFAHVQMILRRVTIGGLGFGVSAARAGTGIIGPFLVSLIVLEEVQLVRNGTGFWTLGGAELLVSRSRIEENLFIGISSGAKLSLSESLIMGNRWVGISIASMHQWPKPMGHPMGHIIGNEFKQNGVGIVLFSGKAEGNWIIIGSNRFVQNRQYGLIVEDPTCPIEISVSSPPLPMSKVPIEIFGGAIEIFGGGNEFHNNGQDLCPPDYPWPPGFRK